MLKNEDVSSLINYIPLRVHKTISFFFGIETLWYLYKYLFHFTFIHFHSLHQTHCLYYHNFLHTFKLPFFYSVTSDIFRSKCITLLVTTINSYSNKNAKVTYKEIRSHSTQFQIPTFMHFLLCNFNLVKLNKIIRLYFEKC